MNLPPRIRRALRAVSARIRLQRAVDAAFVLALPGLGTVALVLASLKLGALDDADARAWFWIATVLPLLGALLGGLRPVGALLPAQLLDREHGLRSRLASAIEFLSLPGDEQSRFMRAAISDAEERAVDLEPARALPLRRPPALGWVGLSVLLVALLGVLEVPRREALAAAPTTPASLLQPDDLEAFESELEPILEDPEANEELRTVAGAMNQILEDLADRRLDRTEALRRIAELERHIAEGRGADAEALERSLDQVGRDLGRSRVVRAASEALRDANASEAAREMEALAEALRESAPSRAELQRLRDALRRASQDRSDDRSEELERSREEVQRLLRRERENQASEDERRLLRRRRRQLERLERDQAEVQAQRRQLERLRREMNQAAEDLNRQARDEAAQSLERAAEDLNRMAREQMTDEQMRDLQQQLRQLRETIRRQQEQQQSQGGQQGQQGQQGQGQGGRMQRFQLRARGQGEQGGYRLLTPGQQGQGQQGQGQQGQGQQGQGQQGQGQQGQGQQGQGQGQQGGTLTLGQGGDATLEIPGMGQQGQRPGQGQGQSRPGPGAGSEHDPQMLEDPTHLHGTTRNTQVEGETGEGPSRSEVILGAADRGFASRGYRRVYTDYRDHAEEVLERDEIPPGYRFYVRRYFQLIRPREERAE